MCRTALFTDIAGDRSCVNVRIIFGGRGIKNLRTPMLNKHNIKRFYVFRFFHFEVYYQESSKQVYSQKAKENQG
jgi:hypothetical protein